MSDSSNRVWASWNLGEKYGNGAALFVGGADAVEFLTHLEALFGVEQSNKIMQHWQDETAKELPGGVTTAEAIANVKNAGLAKDQPTHGENRKCAHGDMVARSGTKGNKQWSGWFCPTPKGAPDKCDPVFA